MSEFSINLPPRLPTAGAAATILTAVVPDPPRHLTQLDNGTILKGVVQGRDPDGLLAVATDKGVIKLSTTANLPPGSQVTLEVRATGDRLQVLVLSSEAPNAQGSGQAPPRGSGSATAPPPTSTGGPATAPPRPAPPPAPVAIVGSSLQGTVVQAAPDTLAQLFRALLPTPPQAAVPPTIPATAQPSPNLQVQSLLPGQAASAPSTPGQPAAPSSAQLPASGAPPAQGLPSALAGALQSDVRARIEALFFTSGNQPIAGAPTTGVSSASQSASLPAGAPKLFAALPTGSEVKLRLIAISPGQGQSAGQPGAQSMGQPVMLPGAAAAPSIMSGRIVGYTPTGHAVLQSPFGAIVLQGNLSVPVGAELSVAIEPATSLPGAVTVPTLPQSLLAFSRGWPGLMEAIALIRQGGATGQAPTAPQLPQAGPRLAAGIVAAIQALRAGDVEALLGGLASLRQASGGREESVRKLRQEFAQISAHAQDKPGVDWRCFFIPLLDDGTVRQINLFYRRDRGKKGGDEADKTGTRFIVEVDMSKMGPFQFDGLVRAKRFDLMVRSHVALTPKMRQDIGALFQEALELGDYQGSLVFQKVKEFPVSPLDEIEKSATRVSA